MESDPQAEFVRLLLKNERRIYAFIRSLLPNRDDAEDVLQETSIVLWKKFDQFEPGSDFAAWAFETARFEIKSHRRKDRRNLTGFSDRLLDTLADEAAASVRDISETEVALEHCLEALPKEDRELLLERYQPGASVANIAEGIGSPVQTIYSRLKRVRRGMMECVEREMTRRDRP